MRRKRMHVLGAGLYLALALPGAAAAAVFLLRGGVVGNGGQSSPPGMDAAHRLYGTVGQAAVGRGANPGNMVCSGFWCFGGSRVVDVEPGEVSVPAEFALGPTTPTPTRDQARFHLAMPRAGEVTLNVFDVAGRQFGEPLRQRFDAGEHELVWRAETARTGIYYVSVAVDGVAKARRTIVLVR
jgi:hypothetical protein